MAISQRRGLQPLFFCCFERGGSPCGGSIHPPPGPNPGAGDAVSRARRSLPLELPHQCQGKALFLPPLPPRPSCHPPCPPLRFTAGDTQINSPCHRPRPAKRRCHSDLWHYLQRPWCAPGPAASAVPWGSRGARPPPGPHGDRGTGAVPRGAGPEGLLGDK